MHKIVSNKFELDLTNYGLSLVEENKWFTENSFTKFSFPFTVYLTDELMQEFAVYLDDNVVFLQTTFNVTYFFGDTKEPAVFEIESQQGKELEVTLRFGFENLDNWDKKLSELPLEVTAIDSIITHAKTIIPKTWPEVNYNYPQIYTEKYNDDEDFVKTFGYFVLNHYRDDVFLDNNFVGEVWQNKNIIQPTPYLLHVLTQGFLDAGFILKGDVLNHPLLQKTILYTDVDYFEKKPPLNHEVIYTQTSPPSTYIPAPVGFGQIVSKYQQFELEKSSKYKVVGHVWVTKGSTLGQYYIKYKNTVISEYQNTGTGGSDTKYDIEEVFYTDNSTDAATQTIDVLAQAHNAFRSGGEENIVYLEVTKILENGDDFPTITKMYNDVDLTRAVPDTTFGKLVTEINKLGNFELIPQGEDMYMNFITSRVNYNNAVDLSNYEELKPLRKFNTLKSFHLKYTEPSNEEYQYEEVLQKATGVTTGYKLDPEDAETVEIDLLPLFQKEYGFMLQGTQPIRSAHSFDLGGEEKIYTAIYNGLIDDLNITEEITPLLLPNIHTNFHEAWFNFRLKAIAYTWQFKMYLEDVSKITKKVYAYGRYHVVTELQKEQISEDLFDIEINTETLE